MTESLKPGDRILLKGGKFPVDELEVIALSGFLKGWVLSRDHNAIVVRFVQKPVAFALSPDEEYEKIEGLP